MNSQWRLMAIIQIMIRNVFQNLSLSIIDHHRFILTDFYISFMH